MTNFPTRNNRGLAPWRQPEAPAVAPPPPADDATALLSFERARALERAMAAGSQGAGGVGARLGHKVEQWCGTLAKTASQAAHAVAAAPTVGGGEDLVVLPPGQAGGESHRELAIKLGFFCVGATAVTALLSSACKAAAAGSAFEPVAYKPGGFNVAGRSRWLGEGAPATRRLLQSGGCAPSAAPLLFPADQVRASGTTVLAYQPRVAVDGGRATVLFTAPDGSNSGIYRAALVAPAEIVGAASRVNLETADIQRYAAVGNLGEGQALTLWQSGAQIKTRVVGDAAGQSAAPEVLLDAGPNARNPALSADGRVGVWLRGRAESTAVVVQFFDAQGAPEGAPKSIVVGGDTYSPVVARDAAGAVLVAWRTGTSLRAALLDPASMDAPQVVPIATRCQGEAVCALTRGFALAYREGDYVMLRLLGVSDGALAPAGAAVVESGLGLAAAGLAIAAVGEEGVLVCWQNNNRAAGAQGHDIFCRLMGPQGAACSAVTMLNSQRAGDQGYPSVGASERGAWVAWEDAAGAVDARWVAMLEKPTMTPTVSLTSTPSAGSSTRSLSVTPALTATAPRTVTATGSVDEGSSSSESSQAADSSSDGFLPSTATPTSTAKAPPSASQKPDEVAKNFSSSVTPTPSLVPGPVSEWSAGALAAISVGCLAAAGQIAAGVWVVSRYLRRAVAPEPMSVVPAEAASALRTDAEQPRTEAV